MADARVLGQLITAISKAGPQIPSMKGDVKGVPFPTSVSLALTSESPTTHSRVIIPETMTSRF